MSAQSEIDRIERVARRLARRGLCPTRVPYSGAVAFCCKPATRGQLCDNHFEDAFNLGMVLH